MLPAARSYRFHQLLGMQTPPGHCVSHVHLCWAPWQYAAMFPPRLGSHGYCDFLFLKFLQSFGACCFSPHHGLGNKTSHPADQEAAPKPPNMTITPQALSRDQTKVLTSDGPRDACTISRSPSLPLACNAIILACWAYSTRLSGSTTLSWSRHKHRTINTVVVQSLNLPWLSETPWTAARQASLSITNSWNLLELKSVMPSNHLILCHPLLFPPSIFPNELALRITWAKYWNFSFSISPSKEYSQLISFRMDWLDLRAVQGTLKSLLQHHSSKASIIPCSAFSMVQLSHP